MYHLKSKTNGKYIKEVDYESIVECEKKDAQEFNEKDSNSIIAWDQDLKKEEVE